MNLTSYLFSNDRLGKRFHVFALVAHDAKTSSCSEVTLIR
jgi:hypothetical protein